MNQILREEGKIAYLVGTSTGRVWTVVETQYSFLKEFTGHISMVMYKVTRVDRNKDNVVLWVPEKKK